MITKTPAPRYSSLRITIVNDSHFRITDNHTDSRVATCYVKENADLVCEALNLLAAKQQGENEGLGVPDAEPSVPLSAPIPQPSASGISTTIGNPNLTGENYCGCIACMEERGESRRHMVLCPICCNKRCPHATSHEHECTGSNEPGQSGSVYADPLPSPPSSNTEQE